MFDVGGQDAPRTQRTRQPRDRAEDGAGCSHQCPGDLAAANAVQLEDAGVDAVYEVGMCTKESYLFPSHRRHPMKECDIGLRAERFRGWRSVSPPNGCDILFIA